MWLSAGAPQAVGWDLACLRNKAHAPVKHDHLFHTLLGLLDVQTALHEAAWDLGTGCKS
jgi:lipid A ethanolaminephosphotransferase